MRIEQKRTDYAIGIAATGLAYILWGILPLYWKAFGSISAIEVVTHRIIWSLGFLVIFLLLFEKRKSVVAEIKYVFSRKNQVIGITTAAVLISINWLVYIFAIECDRIVEASLGYYINPLVNILLATLLLKEHLSKVEWIAVAVAGAGVLCLTLYYGSFPWIALVLAFTFGFYGLIKKKIEIGPCIGLTVETLIIAPFALISLYFFNPAQVSFWNKEGYIIMLLIGTGVVTVIPMLLFVTGAKRISFTLVGFLQYIAPTIMLLLGLFVFHESFSVLQFIAFILIWLALLMFSLSRIMMGDKLAKST